MGNNIKYKTFNCSGKCYVGAERNDEDFDNPRVIGKCPLPQMSGVKRYCVHTTEVGEGWKATDDLIKAEMKLSGKEPQSIACCIKGVNGKNIIRQSYFGAPRHELHAKDL